VQHPYSGRKQKHKRESGGDPGAMMTRLLAVALAML